MDWGNVYGKEVNFWDDEDKVIDLKEPQFDDDKLAAILSGEEYVYSDKELYDEPLAEGDIYAVDVNPDLPYELEPMIEQL